MHAPRAVSFCALELTATGDLRSQVLATLVRGSQLTHEQDGALNELDLGALSRKHCTIGQLVQQVCTVLGTTEAVDTAPVAAAAGVVAPVLAMGVTAVAAGTHACAPFSLP